MPPTRPLRTVSGTSISSTLQRSLEAQPFRGHVHACFERASNCIDLQGRVLALVSADVGRGPFSITLQNKASCFTSLVPHDAVQATACCVTLGTFKIDLRDAAVWNPRLPALPMSFHPTPAIIRGLEPYTLWPPPAPRHTIARRIARRLHTAAHALQQGLRTTQAVDASPIAALAGLGPGLTPAGDDYLLGVLAALHLTHRHDRAPLIAKIAVPQTSTLSAAFLHAAAEGLFAEGWHNLTKGLNAYNPVLVAEAADGLAQTGASSGRDAMAGFTHALRSLTWQAV